MGTTHPLMRLLAEADLTAVQVEERSGVSRRTIYSIATGRTLRPHPRTIARLARALGQTFDEMEAIVSPREEAA